MRNIKKFGALLLAVVMCMGLSVTAFAANDAYGVEVNNAAPGVTYKLYQLLELSDNATETEDATSYAYYVDVTSPWHTFFTTGAGKDFVNVTANPSTLGAKSVKYVTWKTGKDSATDMAAFNKAAAEFAGTAANAAPVLHTAAMAAVGTDPMTVSIDGGAAANVERSTNGKYFKFQFATPGAGYYMVLSSAGSNAMVATNPSNKIATVNEKNSVPELDKKITSHEGTAIPNGASNLESAKIGDIVGYQLKITVPASVTTVTQADGTKVNTGAKNYVIHDRISKGLTLDLSSVVVRHGTTELTKTTDYVVNPAGSPHCGNADCKLEIQFTDTFLAKLTADDVITVDYSAQVNENALVGTYGNTAWLNYGGDAPFGDGQAKTPDAGTGGDPDPDSPKPGVHTFKLDIYKYMADKDGKPTALAGAKFQLADKAGNVIKVVPYTGETTKLPAISMTVGTTGETALTDADRYRVAVDDTEAGAVDIFTTTTGKGVVIYGLGAGEYTLTETEAPAGYNKLEAPVTVKISGYKDSNGQPTSDPADPAGQLYNGTTKVGSINVQNLYGTQMPETGGMGTTILYIVGAILVVGAVVFLVARKRVGDDDDAE